MSSDSEDDAPLAAIAKVRPVSEDRHGDSKTIIQLLLEIRGEQERQAAVLDQHILLQEKNSKEIEQVTFQLQAHVDETNNIKQELQNVAATVSNIYGLLRGRIEKRNRLGGNIPAQTVATVNTTDNAPQEPSKKTGITKPAAKLMDGFVSVPIRYEEIRPGMVYDPVRIAGDDYVGLLNRSATASSFARGLMSYFFDKNVLRNSNFDGTTVLRKDQEPLKKDKLDRRIVLSILDQAELEFPGHVFDRKSFTKIRAVINDKCRHS